MMPAIAPSVSEAVDRLAQFGATVRPGEAAPAVLAHAPWVLLDVMGATLAGSEAAEATALASGLGAGSSAGCTATVLRRGLPCGEPMMAAWLNGTAAVWLELDPGHRHCRTHAPAHVLPAALAEAQRLGATGADLLDAFIVGCETAYRMGGATTPRPEVNAHGTWGMVGAAAAVARLRRLAPATFGHALRLASQLPLATAFRASVAGVTVRHAYVGLSAQLATQAVWLAEAGVVALDDAPGEIYGKILGTAFSPDALCRGLGSDWEFVRDFAKLHACCHHLYPAIDAAADLLAVHPLLPAQIETIVVQTYTVAARLSSTEPRNELAARFSIPYALAAWVLWGDLGPGAFAPPSLANAELLALAARVRVEEDAELALTFPAQRPARVVFHLRDGSVLSAERQSPRGDYLDPLSQQARVAKFDRLAGAALPEASAHTLRKRVLAIAECSNVRQLFGNLTAPPPEWPQP